MIRPTPLRSCGSRQNGPYCRPCDHRRKPRGPTQSRGCYTSSGQCNVNSNDAVCAKPELQECRFPEANQRPRADCVRSTGPFCNQPRPQAVTRLSQVRPAHCAWLPGNPAPSRAALSAPSLGLGQILWRAELSQPRGHISHAVATVGSDFPGLGSADCPRKPLFSVPGCGNA